MNETQLKVNYSSPARSLATRLERIFSHKNHSIYIHPSLSEYYANMNAFLTLAIFVGILLTILSICIYSTTVHRLRTRLQKPLLTPSVLMVTFYPLISLCALVTIMYPESWLVCHTIMHLSFPLGAVIFRELLFHYVGTEMNLIKELDGATMQLNTPPFCCCCVCLPRVMATRTKLLLVRYMIWQLPFVHGGIMLVINAFYFGDRAIYTSVWAYFVPFILASIMLGMWGLNITVRMIVQLRPNYAIMKKMFSLQLIVMLCKLQYMVLDNQLNRLPLGGEYPIDHTIYKQTIINVLILAEMVLVSMLAQSGYRVPAQVQMEHSDKQIVA